MTEVLHRATEPVDFTGRTLEGIAYRYDYPSRVTDDHWRTSYFEEILRGADRRTLSHRAEFPLTRSHSSEGGIEVGEVSFSPSEVERALMFEAHVALGPVGDQLLDEIDQWSDASVTFAPLVNRSRVSPHHGRIVQRAEIRIHELALAPIGTGLAKGAEVLAVRAVDEEEALRRLEVSKRRAAALVLPPDIDRLFRG